MLAHFLFLIALSFSSEVLAQSNSKLDAAEREVIGAAIAQTLKPDSSRWILIDAQTAIFPCGPKPKNIINIGACSGMKLQNKSAEQVIEWIKKSMADVEDETITDLRAKSEVSTNLDQPFSLFVKQVFWHPGTPFAKPADGSAPEFAMVVSRAGFDKSQARALVYIGAVRWSDPSQSWGDYIYLVKEESAWSVKDSARAWELHKK